MAYTRGVTRFLLVFLLFGGIYLGFKVINERLVRQKIHSNYDSLHPGMGLHSISIPWKGDDDDATSILCKNFFRDVTFHIKPSEWPDYAIGAKPVPADCGTMYFSFLGYPWLFEYTIQFDTSWTISYVGPLQASRIDSGAR